jgi:bacteriocin-like protein
MEKIMSKSSRATPTTELVRELRDDELQEVSGGIVAPRDLNSGRSFGIISAPVDAHSGQMSMGSPMKEW